MKLLRSLSFLLITLALTFLLLINEFAESLNIPFSPQITVDGSIDEPDSLFIIDVDGDNDSDILGAGAQDDLVIWWENVNGDGSNWSAHIIDNNINNPRSVFGADLDYDGDIDVLSAAFSDNTIVWWENSDGSGFNWIKHIIDSSVSGAYDAVAKDMDQDNDLDVVGVAWGGDELIWWENRTGDGLIWSRNIIDSNINSPISLYVEDIDKDNDFDIMVGAGAEVAWWENTSGEGSIWEKHPIDQSITSVWSVFVSDIDGDNDYDFAASEYGSLDSIIWWENRTGDGSVLTKYIIEGNLPFASSIFVTDLDLDGDKDVVAAANDSISWWENTVGNGSLWNKQNIDSLFLSPRSLYVADLNGDFALDVLGGSTENNSVVWWESQLELPPTATFTSTPIIPTPTHTSTPTPIGFVSPTVPPTHEPPTVEPTFTASPTPKPIITSTPPSPNSRNFLPFISNPFTETEPNGNVAQANGPLTSNSSIIGNFSFDDQSSDYFYFDVYSDYTIYIKLEILGTNEDYDIVLRDASLQPPIGYSASFGSADENILTSLVPPGRYYIQVYNPLDIVGNNGYQLTVVFEPD